MAKSSKNYKSYRTSAKLFMISGIIFIILSIAANRVAIYLPIGIALLIVGIAIWQKSRKIKENDSDNSSEVNQ